MKWVFSVIILALPACATLAPPVRLEPPPGTLGITGDELTQTGRTQLPDALRASSPIFR
jgi:hypothetical protein